MNARTHWFFVGLLVLTASPALGAEPQPNATGDSVEKARASFQQGVQLYHEGSFEAAVAEFQKAYKLSPSYRVLYNITQAYYELHDYVSASRTLKQYLADGGNDISAARRSQAEELGQKLEARIANLEIRTNVDGADIRVDEIPVGTSPLPFPIAVNAGPRRISAVKAGYTGAARNLTVAGGERTKVVLDLAEPLRPAPATAQSSVGRNVFPAKKFPAAVGGERTALWISLAVTGGLAVATGAFAWLAIDAKKDFDRQLDTYPTTRGQIDSARSRMSTWAAITDGLGAATVVAAGVSSYLAITSRGKSEKSGSAAVNRSVAVGPTLGGMVLYGAW
jgi:tetratricopeptide (TPR) repeat protein